MKQYLTLLDTILKEGNEKGDRTGTGTLSLFGYQMRFNLQEGLPLLTTKQLHLKSIIHELLWFISGDTNIRYLLQNGVTIWTEWAYLRYVDKIKNLVLLDIKDFEKKIVDDASFAEEFGYLGPVYGKQWRAWNGAALLRFGEKGVLRITREPIDQLSQALDLIKTNPDSRRIIVTAWNPEDLNKVALPWCHCFFQFYVHDGKLSCQVYQRSCDAFLGVPFNIASYALLTHMMAQQSGLEVGNLVWVGGDVHLYSNHIDQAYIQLSRTPGELPILDLEYADDLFSYSIDNFEIVGYCPQPKIPAPVAV